MGRQRLNIKIKVTLREVLWRGSEALSLARIRGRMRNRKVLAELTFALFIKIIGFLCVTAMRQSKVLLHNFASLSSTFTVSQSSFVLTTHQKKEKDGGPFVVWLVSLCPTRSKLDFSLIPLFPKLIQTTSPLLHLH